VRQDTFVLIFVAAVGYAYPAYLLFFRQRARRRPVAIEGTRLVQRTATGLVIATVDLSAPFAATFLREESEWALYTVTQGSVKVQMAVAIDGDGSLVRALGMPWPPRVPFRYL
jgi:hypothetical protein